MVRAARGVGLAGVVGLAACNGLFDIQQGQLASPGAEAGADSSVEAGLDSGVESGSDSGAEAGVDSGSAADTSSDAPLCAGPTLYVSVATGSDANAGCSTTAPKKTIGAAIAAAAETSTVTRIEVCKGVYDESPLVLGTATSLMGGYNCNTWARGAAYGYPTFDGTNATVIQNAATTVSAVTLSLSGTALTPAVVVDGFTILGATSGVASSTVIAVLVSNGASPTLSNDQLTGGSLTVPGFIASVGVYLTGGGSPVITNDRINGGSGTVPPTSNEAGHASSGIQAESTGGATVQILDNVINGGSGTASNPATSGGADGSVGISVLTGTTVPAPVYIIHGNTVAAGTGTSTGGAATRGIYLGGTLDAVVDSNSVDGGGGATGTRCGEGVFAQMTGTLSVTANRIYGGSCATSSGATAPQGLKIIGPGTSPLIFNNMIHAGTATNTPAYGPSAVLLSGALTGADVRHNTLVGGTSNGAGSQALWLDVGTSGSTVVNNILAGSGSDVGLTLSQCGDAGAPALAAFENNLVFATPLGLLKWGSNCGSASYATMDAMTAELLATQTGAPVQGNVTLASSCTADGGTDSGCTVLAACASPQTCLPAFFGDWDVASLGYKNLFPASPFVGACPTVSLPSEGNGWTLGTTSTPPCKVTQSSLDDHTLTGLGVDLYGNCRTATPTMGAEEASSATCH